jgi:1,4-alpha-glucan branching enzyme
VCRRIAAINVWPFNPLKHLDSVRLFGDYMPALTDFDLHLIGSGRHWEAYQKLGAHPIRKDGADGVQFAVWAPNADSVSVVGDFNNWQFGATPLAQVGTSGIWEGFVSGIGPGTLYKFGILPRGSVRWLEKSDPYAQAAELRPQTASVVAELDAYQWHDTKWMQQRAETDWFSSPVSIYEVHLGSWRRDPEDPERFLSYRELADQLPEYAADLGFTHLELLPVAEHPLDLSWGYQVTGYFAPTARFGTPQDFKYFVDQCHNAGLGVILDWVPAHFPRDAHALATFDSTHLYEHADPRRGEHPDWGTLVFNYDRYEVRTFLISNALFWMEVYHVDGLRVDAVASMLYLDYSRDEGQWLPNQYGGHENLEAVGFLQELNTVVHERCPGALMVAEESTAWPRVTGPVTEGGLGFDFKWNMGWMHDTLRYMARDPIYRRYHQNELSFSLMYAFSERFVLPLSHDEVVHGKASLLGKMPGDPWQKFANLRLLYAYMLGHPGKKLLYMGSEFGQQAEWNYTQSLDWHLLDLPGNEGQRHRGVQSLLQELNRLYRHEQCLHELEHDWTGFEWIDFLDADNSVIVFRRIAADGSFLLFVFNFTPAVHDDYRIGLPTSGRYREILNTDAIEFGGSGRLNTETIVSEEVPWHGQSHSAPCKLPPLGAFILQLDRS